MLLPGNRPHMLDDLIDLVAGQDAVIAKGLHLAPPRIPVILVPDAMGDGVKDVVDAAAPQPVVVAQMRIAVAIGDAVGARTVALDAMGAEQRFAARDRIFLHIRGIAQLGDVHRHQFGVERRMPFGEGVKVLLRLGPRRIAQGFRASRVRSSAMPDTEW
jgi:hypothetical protein